MDINNFVVANVKAQQNYNKYTDAQMAKYLRISEEEYISLKTAEVPFSLDHIQSASFWFGIQGWELLVPPNTDPVPTR